MPGSCASRTCSPHGRDQSQSYCTQDPTGVRGWCWCNFWQDCPPEICTLEDGDCDGGGWVNEWCECQYSPIIVDLAGNGIELTSAPDGVSFDLNADGNQEQIGWTSRLSDDGFLVLDRNGDGAIGDGTELFGGTTPQPPSEQRNGFLALAVFDAVSGGGNADGYIDGRDPIFVSLRVWIDRDHDGIAGPLELRSLTDAGIRGFSLRYHESRRRDEFGNYFRYRAKVSDSIQRTRWVWDVFLTTH